MKKESIEIYRSLFTEGEFLKPVFEREESPLVAETVRIFPHHSEQEILGFGGSFTWASAYTFSQLTEEQQEVFLKSCFSCDEGNNYSFARLHIHSCDFSIGNYTYLPEAERTLDHFSIEKDREYIIPFIKRAQEYQPSMRFIASPWSPPAWMKTNGSMVKGGKLKREFYSQWAEYIRLFIEEYEKEGIPIWGITVQNEPEAEQLWESCLYSAEEERDFIKENLGPELEQSGYGSVKILCHDHNRDHLFERSHQILQDPDASRYVWGAGFHWYGDDNFQNLEAFREIYPDKGLIFTEGCQEGGNHHGSPLLAERYAHALIGDISRGTSAWIDWNMLLQLSGGPNHVYNLCSAPVLADTETSTLFFESSYAGIGHFSRFIQPGAHKIFSVSSYENIEQLCCKNPDESIIAVILNRTDSPVTTRVICETNETTVTLPGHSLYSLKFTANG